MKGIWTLSALELLEIIHLQKARKPRRLCRKVLVWDVLVATVMEGCPPNFLWGSCSLAQRHSLLQGHLLSNCLFNFRLTACLSYAQYHCVVGLKEMPLCFGEYLYDLLVFIDWQVYASNIYGISTKRKMYALCWKQNKVPHTAMVTFK